MAIERINTSPAINFTETDATFRNPSVANGTALGIAGEFQKGKAFTPTEFSDYSTFQTVMGKPSPCLFENTQQPKYEGHYIAKQYLNEGDLLSAVRILGLSGYNAGDAWGLSLSGGIDTQTVGQSGSPVEFSLNVQYINGNPAKVEYNNEVLQNLYDEGQISSASFGGVNIETGDTFIQPDVFLGDCESFTGARYTMESTFVNETYICVTGTTTVNSTSLVTQEVQNCTVIYSGGTITYNSTFYIVVTNSIVLTNEGTNELTVVQPSQNAIITIQGGIITHDSSNGITIENSTITLPDGTVFSGGTFSICDLAANEAYYDCDSIDPSSVNYSISTGTTTISVPVTTGSTQQFVTQTPSGIIDVTFTGVATLLTGSPLQSVDGTIVSMFRSTAEYNSDETLSFNVEGNVVSISSLNGGIIRPLDDFNLSFRDKDGKTHSYIVSLDRTKSNYLLRVFGNFELCCTNDIPLYIEEHYQVMLEQMLENNEIYCIKPSVCYLNNFYNYKEQYRGAYTPWIVSELQGSSAKRLFRVHTYSDGDIANKDIKISIENIDHNRSTFDLIVRAFSDSDKRPTILEAFRRLTLREDDNAYIARRIGTADGNYQMRSNYIMIEMASDCQATYVPAGFEGYPVRNYNCGKAPRIEYKTNYTSFDRKRQVYLGLSETIGFDADFFKYKGKSNNSEVPFWTGTTNGFHMDKDASSITIDGELKTFDVGNSSFKNEVELIGTDYERKNSRKFTIAFYGGFDGWDIHRSRRTNTDDYDIRGTAAQQGLLSGVFDNYSDSTLDEDLNVINSDFYAYLKGIRTFSNPDDTYITLLATPNVNTFDNSNLVEETIEMIEQERCDVLYVVTTPDQTDEGVTFTVEDVSSLLDGLYDSSYAATYWPWGQHFDQENNVFLWLPPTMEVVRNFTLTDKIAAPWFATANRERGSTIFTQARVELSKPQRDILYEARVNPITKFKSLGIEIPIIWGQKTLQIDSSALDRINVRRLMIYLRRQIQIAISDLVFEPNDTQLREDFTTAVNPILTDVQNRRGIAEFRIQTNTGQAELASNEMTAKVGIKPTPTAEFFNIEFVLNRVDQSFDL